MECPAPVKHAIERIQLGVSSAGDEAVATWLDCQLQAEMSASNKWLNPAKRLKSSAGESPICIDK